MKTQTGIWIDGTKAVVIAFNNGKETVREIESNIEDRSHHIFHEGDKGTFMGTHHINNEAKIEERKRFETHKFLDEVIEEVKDAGDIFIMGPAGMKKKLKTKIEENKQLGLRLAGVIAMDHLTLNQCVAKVREFYQL